MMERPIKPGEEQKKPQDQIRVTQPLSTSSERTPLAQTAESIAKDTLQQGEKPIDQSAQKLEKKPSHHSKKKILILVFIVILFVTVVLAILLSMFGASDDPEETEQEPIVLPTNTPRPTSEAELIPKN